MGTSIDYSSVSHETIYQHITGGPGYAGLMEMSRGWQSVATQMQQFRDAVEQAVRGIGAAQQGAAADAATHSTSALMPWLEESVTAANGVAARVSGQAASFAHTRDSMPPPRVVPEVSFRQDPATWTADHAIEWLPGIQTQNEAAHVAAQQDEQRARELMAGYQGNSNDNLTVRDHFGAAPTVVAEVVEPTPDGVGVDGGSVQRAPGVADPALAHSTAAHPGPVSGVPDHAAPAGTAPQIASPAAATTPALRAVTPAQRTSRRPDQARPGWLERSHSGLPRSWLRPTATTE